MHFFLKKGSVHFRLTIVRFVRLEAVSIYCNPSPLKLLLYYDYVIWNIVFTYIFTKPN